MRRVGRVYVALIDDAMFGVRVAVASAAEVDNGNRAIETGAVVARTKGEMREVIAELRWLVDQLPEVAM